MTQQRYSEERLEDGFEVHLLFSEPLQFRLTDVVKAIEDEFPSLGNWNNFLGDLVYDTSQVVIGLLENEASSELSAVIFSSFPGKLDAGNHYDVAINRALGFPGARQAMDNHASYLSIMVSSKKTDLASRFKAARLVTCVSAVIAADPTCSAVLFPSGDVIASPQDWYEGAKSAAKNEWPLTTWFSYQPTPYAPVTPDGPPQFAWGSIGMAAFNGQEVNFASAPLDPAEGYTYVLGALHLLLSGGNTFRDGDTIGIEDSNEKIRVRFLKEGPDSQTDAWVLMHPASKLDEMAIFGEREMPPRPAGMMNVFKSDENFMDNLLAGKDTRPTTPPSKPAPKKKTGSKPVFGKRQSAPENPDEATCITDQYRSSMSPELQQSLKRDFISFEDAQSRHQQLLEKINQQVREMGGKDLVWIPICSTVFELGDLTSYLINDICLDPFLKWNVLYFAADDKTAMIFDTVKFDPKWQGMFDKEVSANITASKNMWQAALADHQKTGDDRKLLTTRDYIRLQLNNATLAAYKHIFGQKQDHLQQFFAVPE